VLYPGWLGLRVSRPETQGCFLFFSFFIGWFLYSFFFYFFIIIIKWKLIGLCFLKVILKRFKFFNFLICLLIVFLK
jgi:hypothetical protein